MDTQGGTSTSFFIDDLLKRYPVILTTFLYDVNQQILTKRLISKYSWRNSLGFLIDIINPRPTKGGGWYPRRFVSGRIKTHKKWPRASRTSLLHPLRLFWYKKPGVPPLDRGRVSRQSSKVGGGCHLKIV